MAYIEVGQLLLPLWFGSVLICFFPLPALDHLGVDGVWRSRNIFITSVDFPYLPGRETGLAGNSVHP